MAISLSTGLTNALAGTGENYLLLNTDFVFTEAEKRISSGSYAFTKATAFDKIMVMGSLGNSKTFTVSSVHPSGSHIIVFENVTSEIAGPTVAIAGFSGGMSLREIMDNGTIAIFSNMVPRPENADADEGGVPMVWITKNSLAFVPGNRDTNGLKLLNAVDGIITKDSEVEWSGMPTSTGTASWARYYDNDRIMGASTTARRIDMLCGFSSGEMRLTSTTIVEAKKVIVTTGKIEVPKV